MSFVSFNAENLRNPSNMKVLSHVHELLARFEADANGVLLEDAGFLQGGEPGFYLKLRTAQGRDWNPNSHEVIRMTGGWFIEAFPSRASDSYRDPHDVLSGKWAGSVSFVVILKDEQ